MGTLWDFIVLARTIHRMRARGTCMKAREKLRTVKGLKLVVALPPASQVPEPLRANHRRPKTVIFQAGAGGPLYKNETVEEGAGHGSIPCW